MCIAYENRGEDREELVIYILRTITQIIKKKLNILITQYLKVDIFLNKFTILHLNFRNVMAHYTY